MPVHTSSRNQRSCVTTSSAPAPLLPAALQVLGQPCDGAHVQVVGRLVQREHVPVADEQPRQVNASPLAAGKRAHRARPRRHVARKPRDDGRGCAGRPPTRIRAGRPRWPRSTVASSSRCVGLPRACPHARRRSSARVRRRDFQFARQQAQATSTCHRRCARRCRCGRPRPRRATRSRTPSSWGIPPAPSRTPSRNAMHYRPFRYRPQAIIAHGVESARRG